MLQTRETEAHNGEVTCSSVACGRAKNRKLLESSYTPLLLLCWFNRGVTVCYFHVPDFSGCNNTRVRLVARISLIFLSVKRGYLYYR